MKQDDTRKGVSIMAMNTISGYSTTRVTGLTSGLDTDSLIEKAMAAQQAKLDRMYQNKTKLEWKRDAYTDINKLITEFSDKYMSQLSPDNVFSANVYKAFKISVSDKYSAYFDLAGTPNAAISRHQITKTTLADYATIKGEQYRNRVAGLSGTENANSLASIQGTKKLAADPLSSKLSELKYEDGTNVFQFSSSTDKVSFSVNGQTFTFDQGERFSEVINDVNHNPAAKAKMSVTADGSISFESTVKGEKTALVFGNVAGPAVFGKDGAFGIEDLTVKPTSLISGTMTLDEIAQTTGKTLGDSGQGFLEFSINGKVFHFDGGTQLKDMIDTVNADPDAQVTLSYDRDRDRFMLRSDLQGSGTRIKTENLQGTKFFGDGSISGIAEEETQGYQTIERQSDTIATAAAKMGIDLQLDGEGKFSFQVNGVDFSFNATDTLDKMMNAVNGNKDAKARLTYSQITDSFILTSSETGRNASVSIKNNGANAFGDANSFFGAAESEEKGKDATIVIDDETITQASNTFTLDGIQFTLKTAFDAENNSENLGPANFSVEQDIDKVVDKVKAFVKDYNALTQSLYSKVTEEIDYDYSPLTQAQRENDEMSDKDIEKWDAEAKKGILRNDNTIKELLSSLRMDLFKSVEGTGLSAYDIGFDTSKYSQGQYGGQISFDEDKFREAMKKDPEAVSRVMANVSTSTSKETEQAESGMITRFFDQMSDFRKQIRGVNLKNTNDKIDDMSDSMDAMIKKMYIEQERLYSQFAQMESILSQYQAQSTWLTQQISAVQ